MSWSYSKDPSESALDAVRFLVGDTDPDEPLLENEEILYVISQHGNPTVSAVVLANSLAVRYAKRAVDSKTVGDLSIKYADRSAAFRDLATSIGASGGASAVRPLPLMTGRTYSQKETADSDADRIDTHVHVGEDDDPRNSDRRFRYPERLSWYQP